MNKQGILKSYFGYHAFREGQEFLIDSILEGHDTLGIMPTGAGKSICYQVPAMLFKGITLVISPLISLMKDQVGALKEAGIPAAYLNSSLTARQYNLALRNAEQGQYKIIYVAPERLLTENFIKLANQVEISMVSVDEAHCVSQWGQDFRPSYLKISEFIEKLNRRPILSAFTATATEEVKKDIINLLRLKNPKTLTTGFDRSNLYFAVEKPEDKYKRTIEFIRDHKTKSGIIYCTTRKTVEEVCDRLIKDGIPATRYHAGLTDEERKENQDRFIYDTAPIMVATNAFGMGIDKSNVRYVIHYNMPKNLESYYQEAGRAGRDGLDAQCLLLYNGQDVMMHQFLIDRSNKEELDELTRRLVREKDLERLKRMTFYCATNDCLREYILRYFGERAEHYCDNCSNCLTHFNLTDVTYEARHILRCIDETRQRYGITMILETLKGSRSLKVTKQKMQIYESYGKLKDKPMHRLRQIMNHLILKDYLLLTSSEYPVLKLTEKSKGVLYGLEKLEMKMAGGSKKKEKERVQKQTELAERLQMDYNLFEELRKLRLIIAQEERKPPYIIFSDKTLTDMCRRMPKTKEEMLKVVGVGEVKYARYGYRFLSRILEG